MSKRIHDSNGWYEIKDNPISKVGVFPYLGSSMGIPDVIPGKIYWVLRPASSLQDPDFLDSTKLLPWIDEHTMLGENYTPAEEKGVEGVTGESAYFKAGIVYTNLKVFSEDLKKNIDSGKVELSLGYTARYERQSGIYKSQRYDFVQRELRGNHLALVDKGRMGSDVAVLDELDRLFLLNEDGDTMNKKQIAEALAKTWGIGFDEAMKIVDSKGVGQDGYDKYNMTMDGIGAMVEDRMGKAMDAHSESMKAMVKDAMDNIKEGYNKPVEDMGTHDKGKGMDAADKATIAEQLTKIADQDTELEQLRGIAQDQEVKVELEAKNALAERLSPIVGTFDHASLTLANVVAYGLKKFDLEAPEGAESAVLNAHMNAVEVSGGRFAVEDKAEKSAKPSAVINFLQEA